MNNIFKDMENEYNKFLNDVEDFKKELKLAYIGKAKDLKQENFIIKGKCKFVKD